ncbi:MAG TPA: VTT domain-containing protein [Bacteroidales bacterium]|nr:VTT domain-containing protein [Bacteroidales bacterium]
MGKKIRIRKKTLFVWIIFVLVILILYFVNRDWFDISFLKGFVDDNKFFVIVIYLFVLSFIGLTFIPSTPFAIAGVLMFSPLEAYTFNLLGIITSSFVVYNFTRFLRLDTWIESKYPDKIVKVRNALRRKEMLIIAGWSFFPAVPTDLITYVASSLRIPYWKCMVGILIGEGALNAFYIFSVDFFI